jgi:hypothetical protein
MGVFAGHFLPQPPQLLLSVKMFVQFIFGFTPPVSHATQRAVFGASHQHRLSLQVSPHPLHIVRGS